MSNETNDGVLFLFCRYIFLFSLFSASSHSQSDFAKNYLSKFGYIDPRIQYDPSAAVHLQGEHITEDRYREGLFRFQKYYGIPVTGEINSDTLIKMQQGRCGLPDVELNKNRRKRYALAGRWHKRHLNYAISRYSHNVTHENIDHVVDFAFNMWQNVANIQLHKVNETRKADLLLSFFRGSHSNARTYHMNSKLSFDGPGGVLAHASFPMVGEIHFDDAEHWLVDDAKSEGQIGYNLMWAAVHELGHALGLKHTNVENNIMNPLYKSANKLSLGQDDIRGIQRLYGKPQVIETVVKEGAPKTTINIVPKQDPECITVDTFDAVLTLGKTVYMFKGTKVWVLSSSEKSHFSKSISQIFHGVSGPVTAVMAGINNKVYFFRGKLYWRWDSVRRTVDRGFPRNVAGFGHIYEDVIAAFKWSFNGKGYMFGKGRYWRYDFWTQRIDVGYPRPTSTWRGIPYDVDAITTAPDSKTYIFKGQNYWLYSDTQYKVLKETYTTAKKWKTCVDNPINHQIEESWVAELNTGSDDLSSISDHVSKDSDEGDELLNSSSTNPIDNSNMLFLTIFIINYFLAFV